MVHLPVAMAAACAAGVCTGVLWPECAPGALGLGSVGWIGTLVAWRSRLAPMVAACGLTGLAAWGVALGGSAMSSALDPPLARVLAARGRLPADGARAETPVRLEGRLLVDAAPAGRGTALRIEVRRVWPDAERSGMPTAGQVWLNVAGDAASSARPAWRAGRRVAVEASLRRPSAYRNPGAPDAGRQAARRRLALVGSVKSAHLVEVLGPGRWWEEAASAARAHARRALARASGPGSEAASVGAAVLIGDRAGLSPELEDRLQRAGTFHVIAISGGNIALWAVMATWLASRATRRRGATFAVTAVALVAYAVLVGGGASVLRATGMALVGAATRWLDQRVAAINVLAATGGGLVLADPLLTLDVGFWLTSAATAGLVLGLPARRPGESRLRSGARTLVLASCAAEAALLPIVASVFQQVTLAGLVVSAVAVPSMALLQIAALAVVIADPWSSAIAGVAGQVLRWTTFGVTDSARLADVWPWFAWKVPPPAWTVGAAYYAALGAAAWARRADPSPARATIARPALAVAIALAVWIAVSPTTIGRSTTGWLTITAFDVGQGDATLVEFPTGQRLLVDAGGVMSDGRDIGARVVGPALRAMGHRRLDVLAVTHADLDHIGGAATLVSEFRPAEVWAGIPVVDHGPSLALRAAADRVGAAWREVRRGERVTIGGVDVRVLHPEPPEWERPRVRNDDSVVIELRLGRARVVLAGDAGREVEVALAPAVHAADGDRTPVTVLKVAHHGSQSASSVAWLAALRPRAAIISVGAANPFGHPAAAVLTRLDDIGAGVWRTDRDGAITLRTDGRVLEMRAMSGRRTVLSPRRRRRSRRPPRLRPAWRRSTGRSADRA